MGYTPRLFAAVAGAAAGAVVLTVTVGGGAALGSPPPTTPAAPAVAPAAPVSTLSVTTSASVTTVPAASATTSPAPPGAVPTTVAGGAFGYWLVRSDGLVTSLGLPALGDLSQAKLSYPIAGAAGTPGGRGYWLVSTRGGIFTFGNAGFQGSAGSLRLRRPIVAMAPTPDGGGYWLVASDGGIFAYGDARYFGSMGGKHLNKPIVGIASTPDGGGYWLVASDGGIFAYGDARFFGSTGRIHLNKPIVAMAPTADGQGYWLVASDGGIFAYGDAAFLGSTGHKKLASPISAMAVTPDGRGYWLAGRSGAVFAFGDAPPPAGAPSPQTTAPSPPAGHGAAPSPHVVAILAGTYTPSGAPGATTTTSQPGTTTSRPATTTTTRQNSTTTTRPPTTTTTTPGTSPSHPYAAGASGYDVSWPQCRPKGSSTTLPLPASPSFAIVGVNSGVIDGFNSCFAAESAWAGPNMSVYVILGPAPGNRPPQEMSGPKASCAKTSSLCQGYDWGYNYATADIAFVHNQHLAPRIWWLDVEVAEGWPTTKSLQPVNAQIIQGALDAVRAAGDIAGIYCTWYQWGEITGSYVPPGGVPIWVPGAGTLSGNQSSAQAYCQRALLPGDPSQLSSSAIGFADGVPWLSQYGYAPGELSPIDPDYAC